MWREDSGEDLKVLAAVHVDALHLEDQRLNRGFCTLPALPLNKCCCLIHRSSDWSRAHATAPPSRGATQHQKKQKNRDECEPSFRAEKCEIVRLIFVFPLTFPSLHFYHAAFLSAITLDHLILMPAPIVLRPSGHRDLEERLARTRTHHF